MSRLMLLGPAVLADHDGVVVAGRAAQRHCIALLALLAGHRRGLARERAIAFLWPDVRLQIGRHRLSVAMHVIRKRVGEEALLATGDALRLNPSVWQVDVWSFEMAVAEGDFEGALRSYSGPLLDGFYLSGAAEYEHWLERWREQLARRYVAVLQSLAGEAEQAGELERGVEYRREIVSRQPCSGADAAALIRALGAAGRPDEAVRSARAYTLTVREDYGLDPDPAVAASIAALRSRAGELTGFAGPRALGMHSMARPG